MALPELPPRFTLPLAGVVKRLLKNNGIGVSNGPLRKTPASNDTQIRRLESPTIQRGSPHVSEFDTSSRSATIGRHQQDGMRDRVQAIGADRVDLMDDEPDEDDGYDNVLEITFIPPQIDTLKLAVAAKSALRTKPHPFLYYNWHGRLENMERSEESIIRRLSALNTGLRRKPHEMRLMDKGVPQSDKIRFQHADAEIRNRARGVAFWTCIHSTCESIAVARLVA